MRQVSRRVLSLVCVVTAAFAGGAVALAQTSTTATTPVPPGAPGDPDRPEGLGSQPQASASAPVGSASRRDAGDLERDERDEREPPDDEPDAPPTLTVLGSTPVAPLAAGARAAGSSTLRVEGDGAWALAVTGAGAMARDAGCAGRRVLRHALVAEAVDEGERYVTSGPQDLDGGGRQLAQGRGPATLTVRLGQRIDPDEALDGGCTYRASLTWSLEPRAEGRR